MSDEMGLTSRVLTVVYDTNELRPIWRTHKWSMAYRTGFVHHRLFDSFRKRLESCGQCNTDPSLE